MTRWTVRSESAEFVIASRSNELFNHAHDDYLAERRAVDLEAVAAGRPEQCSRREPAVSLIERVAFACSEPQLGKMLPVSLREPNGPGLIEATSPHEHGTRVATLDRPWRLLPEPALGIGVLVADLDYSGTSVADTHQVHGLFPVERATDRGFRRHA
jgi:hypothetical protein